MEYVVISIGGVRGANVRHVLPRRAAQRFDSVSPDDTLIQVTADIFGTMAFGLIGVSLSHLMGSMM